MRRRLLLGLLGVASPATVLAATLFQTVVFFKSGSDSLSENAQVQIELALAAARGVEHSYVILAYADNSGNIYRNKELTGKRAMAVSNSLIAGGASRTVVRMVGCGVAAKDGSTAWQHRRAEILVVNSVVNDTGLESYCRSLVKGQ